MNKIGTYLSILTMSTAVGCGAFKNDSTEVLYRNVAEAQGRDVQIVGPSKNSPTIIMRIGTYNGHGFSGSAFIYTIDKDNDKSFDEIRTWDAKDDSIKDLASINTLDKILKTLTGPNASESSQK